MGEREREGSMLWDEIWDESQTVVRLDSLQSKERFKGPWVLKMCYISLAK
jgi:hypothetical protein